MRLTGRTALPACSLATGPGRRWFQQSKEGGILSTHLGCDGSGGSLLMIPAGGTRLPASHETIDKKLHYIKMQGNELLRLRSTAWPMPPGPL